MKQLDFKLLVYIISVLSERSYYNLCYYLKICMNENGLEEKVNYMSIILGSNKIHLY